MRLKILFLTVIFLSTACNSSEKRCFEIRELSISPEKGIGPYYYGMKEKQLVANLCPEFTKKEENSWFSGKKTIHYFLENMSFTIRNDRLIAIHVWGTFKGSFEGIDLDYDKQLLDSYGEVVEHNGEYRILDFPNISFGNENSDNGKYIRIYE